MVQLTQALQSGEEDSSTIQAGCFECHPGDAMERKVMNRDARTAGCGDWASRGKDSGQRLVGRIT